MNFHESMMEYKEQIEKGSIQKAYRGLIQYIKDLRSHFSTNYPDFLVANNIYSGYMDLTYFHFFPKSLKSHKLKIVILFMHETFRFEVWLSGNNKKVLEKYYNLFNENKWNKYHLTFPAKGVDSILDKVLIENPNFSDLDVLTELIEKRTLKFIEDIETFLSEQE